MSCAGADENHAAGLPAGSRGGDEAFIRLTGQLAARFGARYLAARRLVEPGFVGQIVVFEEGNH
ncbi:hypothetical protein D3C83_312730 [compost metagenome]